MSVHVAVLYLEGQSSEISENESTYLFCIIPATNKSFTLSLHMYIYVLLYFCYMFIIYVCTIVYTIVYVCVCFLLYLV